MGRRQRRVLYEVVQPSKDDLSIWKSRPAPVRPDPTPIVPNPSDDVPGAGVSRSAYEPVEEPVRVSVSRQTIAITAAAVAMLVLVAFSAGRHYEAASGPPGDEQVLAGVGDSNDTTQPDNPKDNNTAASAGKPASDTGSAAAAKPSTNNQPAQPKPAEPQLKAGYHYVVVQHFGSKRQAAHDAADYLRSKGVPCAVIAGRGKDYRVLATEAFLIDQDNKAASQREAQKAERLRVRIREIGDEYNAYLVKQKKPGYQFKGCYMLKQR